jgi:dUTP pyrophosphatase
VGAGVGLIALARFIDWRIARSRLTPKIKFKVIRDSGKLPERQTKGSSGFDLFAAIDAPRTLVHGERALVPTGIAVSMPLGVEGQVRSRSGIARHDGVIVLNAPGTIDSDFRGEIQVLLVNMGVEAFTVQPGDRIAQLVFTHVCIPTVETSQVLDGTKRGNKGFGSTGR